MTIKTLARKGFANSEIAKMLGVTEGAVRYQLKRMTADSIDGRCKQQQLAADYADQIAYYKDHLGSAGVSLADLHDWLVDNFDYPGSKRSVHRYWVRTYPKAKLWARRRVETPAGVQGQVDWAHHTAVIVGGRERQLYSFHCILSHSRMPAIIWSLTRKQLAWHTCHLEAFTRIGGVPATVRVDNEKTEVVLGNWTGA
jgi:transposase